MRGKLLFVVGLAAGYVVGARAGRPAYDAIVDRAHGVAHSPTVQDAGQKAKDVLEERAPKVAAAAQTVASTAAGAADAAATAEPPSADERPAADDAAPRAEPEAGGLPTGTSTTASPGA